jgi:hypothetical protein
MRVAGKDYGIYSGQDERRIEMSANPKHSNGICRDCGEANSVPWRNWGRAFHPRCLRCGGLLDRQGGRLPYRRTPKGKRVIR